MRYFIALGLSAVASFAVTAVDADTLRKESFEGCTGSGYSLLYGSFGGDANDGIQCGSQVGPRALPFSFGSTVTGQDGEDYIGLEDLIGFGTPNPNAVVLSDIGITGYSNLGINFLFAAPAPAAGRYEASDYLEVQYSVDDGSWVTVGRFIGAGSGTVGMLHDVDLDGTTLTSVTNAMQRFTYPLNNRARQGAVSGSTLSVRIAFSSDGAQEEMAFDDIVVTGDLAVPVMSFSSATYSVHEDGTPSGAAVVIERSGLSMGTTSIDVTFTAGSALGGGVDFDSTTLVVPFADGETSKTIALPIVDDDIEEGDETFSIGLATNGSNALLGGTTSAVVTILDNDASDAGALTDAGATTDVTSDSTTTPDASTPDTSTEAITSDATSDTVTTDGVSSAVTSDDLSTNISTTELVTTDGVSTAVNSDDLSTDISTTELVTTDVTTDGVSSLSTDSTSDPATPIVDAGADAGDVGAPASDSSCDCRVGARSSSSTGWFGIALTGLVLARLHRRRGNGTATTPS